MWKGERKEVLNLTFFSLVSGGKPKWNYFILQYHQSDSAPTYCSFLLLSCHLLVLSFTSSSAAVLCIAKKFNVRFQVYLLFSTPLAAPPTLYCLCFLPTCFALLMGHREVINSQHSVSESAHQMRAGLKHSQLRILLIPQPKEKYPHGPLSDGCVFVRVCERERVGERRIAGQRGRVMANLNHRYCSEVSSFGINWQLPHHSW